ncbi:MAG: cyclase family protein [Candidatus Rariloculaceae bacterium]
MSAPNSVIIAVSVAAAFSLVSSAARAQAPPGYTAMDPIPSEFVLPDPCDNPTTRMWGPDDEVGNLNYLTQERVSDTLGLIRLGKVYEIGRILEPGQMGFSAYLDFKTNLGTWPGRDASNAIFNNEETLGNSRFNPDRAGVMQFELGTQLDGFNHVTQEGITYNCFDTRNPADHYFPEGNPGDLPRGNPGDDYVFRGHMRMGIENVRTIVARAVLIDVAQLLRDREREAGRDPEQFPPADYEFTPEELEQALIRQGLSIDDIQPGDALMIRTGWSARFWTANPADPRDERVRYLNRGENEFRPGGPGIDARAIQWTINRRPVLVGGDTKTIENSNPADPTREVLVERPGHVSWLNSGIYMLEDMDLEVLAADCEQERAASVAPTGAPDSADESCYISTLVVQTTPVRGSGGSTVAPTLFR